MLRLALRDPAVENGPGVLTRDGTRVTMDSKERTIMCAMHGGATAGQRETHAAITVAADLHARHHFTQAAAVDGSLAQKDLPTGGMTRKLAYGIWEGPRGPGWRSNATAAGLWGASIAPDGEIADAELAAIHAYLREIVARTTDPSAERVLIMSDSLGCLDALESAWRAGHARGLRTHDRGALIESCCVLRAQLQLVVFMYVPAHRGVAFNAMADAAAKAHLNAAEDDLADVATRVTSRPVIYTMPSDFGGDGTLRPPKDPTQPRCVLWDRRMFPGVRRRAARWVHARLNDGLHGTYVDSALIGRRWHHGDAQSYSEVAKAVYLCLPLNHKEEDPVSRMAGDAHRVGIASLARKRDAVGTRGAQDMWVQRAAAHERATKRPGAACRQMARGCAVCMPRVWTSLPAVCGTCNGWRERKRRGTGHCRTCGATTLCADCGGAVGCTACKDTTTVGQTGKRAPPTHTGQPPLDHDDATHHGSAICDSGWVPGARQRRRLGPLDIGPPGHTHTRWVGFAGLAQTTVERLMADGGDAADQRASSVPHAATLATARHVHGGECLGVACTQSASAEALTHVRHMQKRVATAGGRASTIMRQLEHAETYLAATANARSHLPESHWTAYHRLVAGDLDAPDWPVAHAGDPREQGAARKELAVDLAKGALRVGECCGELKQGWTQAAAREVVWRERQEAGRELLRVCVRAWREVADGLPAGAARWEMLWRRGVDCQLSRRLNITQAALARWDEEWHPARRLLTWMRLVRAGSVRRARVRSSTWRETQAE